MVTKYQDLGYNRILVALDGTEQQDEVLHRAIVVAANNNSELYIGHVIDSTALETAGTYPVDLVASLEKDFRDSIEDQVEAARKIESIKKVEVIVKAGRIRETLKDDMIDVGDREGRSHSRDAEGRHDRRDRAGPHHLRGARAFLHQVRAAGIDQHVPYQERQVRHAGAQVAGGRGAALRMTATDGCRAMTATEATDANRPAWGAPWAGRSSHRGRAGAA